MEKTAVLPTLGHLHAVHHSDWWLAVKLPVFFVGSSHFEILDRERMHVPPDSGATILIAADDNGTFLGVLRFEAEGEATRISVATNSAARGRGIGTAMIIRGSQWIFRNIEITRILAYIRPDNRASCSAFRTAGFQFDSEVVSHGQRALRFVLEKTARRDGMPEA